MDIDPPYYLLQEMLSSYVADLEYFARTPERMVRELEDLIIKWLARYISRKVRALPGSGRTKRLRKKRAKALAYWPG